MDKAMGTVQMSIRNLHPKLGRNNHASAVTKRDPQVQNISIKIRKKDRYSVVENSANKSNAIVSPPIPTPTRNLKSVSTVIFGDIALSSPPIKIKVHAGITYSTVSYLLVQVRIYPSPARNEKRRPYLSATIPHVSAPAS